ncbi:MAG TPA: nuclear transport factor 2 family protein [Thermoanaerobaculia bacterium]|nr:nuclear transport factor 2 family protein [Thermoanaerobaculia bacterium]
MKKLFLVVLLAASADVFADDVADLRRLDRELVVATYTGDAAWWDRHMSADYTLLTSSGKIVSRELLLAQVGDKSLKMEAYEPTEVVVRTFGDTAVITGRILQKYTFGDTRVEADLRYTDVWLKTKDGWKTVAGHASAINVKREKAQ